jgi:hypothetical protein
VGRVEPGRRIEHTVGVRSVAIAALLLAFTPSGSAGTLAASDGVTIFSRPGILFGSVASNRAGEAVTIQARDCGHDAFRVVSGAETHAGGGWSIHFGPGINSTVRAVWRNARSAPITLREPVRVTLNDRPGRRVEVIVTAQRNFWRKRVRIQRFARRLDAWVNARWVVLADTHSRPGSPFTSTVAEIALRLPAGTRVRAIVPASEARPCYVAGTSPPIVFRPKDG